MKESKEYLCAVRRFILLLTDPVFMEPHIDPCFKTKGWKRKLRTNHEFRQKIQANFLNEFCDKKGKI